MKKNQDLVLINTNLQHFSVKQFYYLRDEDGSLAGS